MKRENDDKKNKGGCETTHLKQTTEILKSDHKNDMNLEIQKMGQQTRTVETTSQGEPNKQKNYIKLINDMRLSNNRTRGEKKKERKNKMTEEKHTS